MPTPLRGWDAKMAPHHFKVQKENTDMNDRLVLGRAPGSRTKV